VNTHAGALTRGIQHIAGRRGGDRNRLAWCSAQLPVGALDVGKAVDVELEHVRRILRAQTVAGAQILIDPYAQGALESLGYGHRCAPLSRFGCIHGVAGTESPADDDDSPHAGHD